MKYSKYAASCAGLVIFICVLRWWFPVLAAGGNVNRIADSIVLPRSTVSYTLDVNPLITVHVEHIAGVAAANISVDARVDRLLILLFTALFCLSIPSLFVGA